MGCVEERNAVELPLRFVGFDAIVALCVLLHGVLYHSHDRTDWRPTGIPQNSPHQGLLQHK